MSPADYQTIRDAHAAMLQRFTKVLAVAMQDFQIAPGKLALRDAIGGLRLIADQLPLLQTDQAAVPIVGFATPEADISAAETLKARLKLIS